jgi:tripartite-type tricarboxylate transporter receptor subunit TctC
MTRYQTAARAALCAVLLAASTSAFSQAFPSKNITLIMPLPASSTYTVLLRAMGDMIQQKTGKPIVMDPAIGADGTIAPQKLARAEPDGHTISLVWAAPMTLNPHIQKDIGYDPVRDFAPITMLTRHGQFFVAHPGFPANNLREFIALAKAKPGTIKVGTAGTGGKVGLIQLSEATGVKLLEVPYKSPGQMDPAVMSGEVDVVVYTVGATIGYVRSGKVKPLFIGSKNRSPLAPDVKSMSEDIPNFEMVSWFALIAPAKTPADRIEWLNREWNAALKDPKIADRMTNGLGYDIVAGSPQDLANQIKAELPMYERIVKEHGIQ